MIYICDTVHNGIVYEVYRGTSGTMYFNLKQ